MSAKAKPAPVLGLSVTIQPGALLSALALISMASQRRGTVPILANVRLTAGDGVLSMACTDLDVTLSASLPCSVVRVGDVTVPAKQVAALVRHMPRQADLDVSDDGDRLVLTCGPLCAKLHTMPAEDFPTDKELTPHHTFTVPAPDLRKLIDKTAFAISTEETRYYLNGVYLHPLGDHLRAVATDGHRMGVANVALPVNAADFTPVIVPREAVRMLRSMIGTEEPIVVRVGALVISFTVGPVTLRVKAIDGSFPDYGRVIPQDNPNKLRMKASDLDSAANSVTAIATDRTRALRLDMQAKSLFVSHTNAELGECSTMTDAVFDGVALQIGLNGKYLTDITRRMTGEIEMRIKSGSDPISVHDPADPSYSFVIMPMRI